MMLFLTEPAAKADVGFLVGFGGDGFIRMDVAPLSLHLTKAEAIELIDQLTAAVIAFENHEEVKAALA